MARSVDHTVATLSPFRYSHHEMECKTDTEIYYGSQGSLRTPGHCRNIQNVENKIKLFSEKTIALSVLADGTASVNQTRSEWGEMEPSNTPLLSNKTPNETKEDRKKETSKGYAGRSSPEMNTEKSKPTIHVAENWYRDIGERCLGVRVSVTPSILDLG